jgi:hypothetical protein
MKLFLRTVLLGLLLSSLGIKAQTVVCTTMEELNAFLDDTTAYGEIHLQLIDIEVPKKQNENLRTTIKTSASLKQVKALSLYRVTISTQTFRTMLKEAGVAELQKLTLHYVTFDKKFSPDVNDIFKQLNSLVLRNFSVGEKFLKRITDVYFPSLKKLVLQKIDQDDDMLFPLKVSMLLPQLEYLDLSHNELGNEVFSIFPYNEPGNLKTLLLNDIGLEIESRDRYDDDNYAICKKLTMSLYYLNLNEPFFQNLNHLEIAHSTDEFENLLLSLEDEDLARLDYFKGFRPELSDVNRKKTIAENKKRIEDYLRQFAKSDFKSRVINHVFTSPAELNVIINAGKAVQLTELALTGDRWHPETVEAILTSGAFSNVKVLKLIATNLEDKDIQKLISQYNNISFDLIIKGNGKIWPRLGRKLN